MGPPPHPPADLAAVQHQVVGAAAGACVVTTLPQTAVGAYERVVERLQLAGERVALEQRTADQPNELVVLSFQQLEVPGELPAKLPARLKGGDLRAGQEQQEVALPGVQPLDQVGGDVGREVLDDVGCKLPSGHAHPGQTAHAVGLGPIDEPVDLAAADHGVVGRSGMRVFGPDVHADDLAALGQHPVEDLIVGTLRDVCDVVQLQPVADVRGVGAVAVHRVVEGHAGERDRQLLSVDVLPHACQHVLYVALDVALVHERHLHVDLGELRLPVGAGILVAEASRHLIVAVEAADHQHLLVQLGRLRQRVEGAWRDARRDQEVPRAFGRAPGQHRRLDLHEALAVKMAADGG